MRGERRRRHSLLAALETLEPAILDVQRKNVELNRYAVAEVRLARLVSAVSLSGLRCC